MRFVSNEVETRKKFVPIRRFYMSLYGGEPTMNAKELKLFCDEVDAIARRNDIELSFDMTTNLTLLNDELLELISKYQIRMQVSIDGTREQHNVRRIFKNGQGTYDLIISNLKLLREKGLKHLVTIRLNIDEDNLASAEEIAETAKEYSDDVYFGFLAQYKGYNDSYGRCISESCYSAIATAKLNNIVRKLGYVAPTAFGRKAPCAISAMNKMYVDCHLNVYKCEMLLNQPACSIGKINESGEMVYNENYYKQMSFSPFLFEKCENCKFLPLCAGGCPAKGYINAGGNDGEIRKPFCLVDEDSLKVYLKDYVKHL